MTSKQDDSLPAAIKPETLTPELLGQLLQNQAKELELRYNELSLKKQEDNNSFEFAKAALSAKTSDRKDERENDLQLQKTRLLFASVITLVITTLIIYALSIGKDNFAMELIKAVIFILSGGVGGFAIGKSAHKDVSKEKKSRNREDME
jgi:hypothetical protein